MQMTLFRQILFILNYQFQSSVLMMTKVYYNVIYLYCRILVH